MNPLRWVMICRVCGLCFGLACGPLLIYRPRRAHRLGTRGRSSCPSGDGRSKPPPYIWVGCPTKHCRVGCPQAAANAAGNS